MSLAATPALLGRAAASQPPRTRRHAPLSCRAAAGGNGDKPTFLEYASLGYSTKLVHPSWGVSDAFWEEGMARRDVHAERGGGDLSSKGPSPPPFP